MKKEVVLGFLRQAFTALGPFLVAQGLAGDTPEVMEVTGGAILAITGLVWGIFDKSGALVPSLLSVGRHLVGAVSGILIATGALDAGSIEAGSAFALAAVAFGGSFVNKNNVKKKSDVASG